MYDVSHVLLEYPRLGGMDVVAHHVLFALASYVCGSNRVFPWPFAWLIIGELSTLPLNLRWVLIQSGRGDTRLMKWTNRGFALSFFVGRVVVYGLGLLHLSALGSFFWVGSATASVKSFFSTSIPSPRLLYRPFPANCDPSPFQRG